MLHVYYTYVRTMLVISVLTLLCRLENYQEAKSSDTRRLYHSIHLDLLLLSNTLLTANNYHRSGSQSNINVKVTGSDSVQDPNPGTTKYQVFSKQERLGISMYNVSDDHKWLANQTGAEAIELSVRTASKPSSTRRLWTPWRFRDHQSQRR